MPIMVYTELESTTGATGKEPPIAPIGADLGRATARGTARKEEGTTCAGCRDWQEHGPFGMAFCRRFGLQPRNTARCHAWMSQEGVRQ